MTCRPSAALRSTRKRNCGLSSGAPPVMSSVGIAGWRRSSSITSAAVSRLITSRRSGPASTWQWPQVWLQSLPTLTWSTSMRRGFDRAVAVTAEHGFEHGDARRRERPQLRRGSANGCARLCRVARGMRATPTSRACRRRSASARRAPGSPRRGWRRRRGRPPSSARRSAPFCRLAWV